MGSNSLSKKDELMMQLTHYFITVKNYTPMLVKGVKNEIWLENLDEDYRIIRINGNYIHNNEQLRYDLFKIKNIVKQVKKKTLTLSVDTLNIILDAGTNVNFDSIEDNHVNCVNISSEKELKKESEISKIFPDLKENLVENNDAANFVMNVTKDINKTTEKHNREYANLFRIKNINVTYILIAINIIIYLVYLFGRYFGNFDIYNTLALHRVYVQRGEIYRLITACFCHQNIFHLGMNMYALYVIGSQIESYLGKGKYLAVYLFSGITGSLLSLVVYGGWSLGASGAIFGLMGALLYFGYHYRLFLDSVLKRQIIPLIALNLLLGFLISNIDNSAHIGGLIGGLFMSMALGIKGKSSKQDRINGIICSLLFVGALIFILFK